MIKEHMEAKRAEGKLEFFDPTLNQWFPKFNNGTPLLDNTKYRIVEKSYFGQELYER